MQTWMITGCSTGIGRDLAKAVLERGWNAVVTARNVETIEVLQASYPGRALALPLDVTNPSQIVSAVQKSEEKFGRIDVIVNNAGIVRDGALHKMTKAQRSDRHGPRRAIQHVSPGY